MNKTKNIEFKEQVGFEVSLGLKNENWQIQ